MSFLLSLKLFEEALSHEGKKVTYPASTDDILTFVNYSHFVKKHAAASTEAYLSALKMFHVHHFGSAGQFDARLVKQVVLGLKNRAAVTFEPKSHRLAMSFSALKVLGNMILDLDWPKNDRIVVWTACLVCFWGSFRMGEILSATARTPSFHALLWDAISFPKCSKGVKCLI